MGLETRRAWSSAQYQLSARISSPTRSASRCSRPPARRARDRDVRRTVALLWDHGSPKGGPCVGDPFLPFSSLLLFGFPCEVLFFFRSHRSQPRIEEKKAWGRAVCELLPLAVSFLTRHSSLYVNIEASAYGAEEYTQAEGVL